MVVSLGATSIASSSTSFASGSRAKYHAQYCKGIVRLYSHFTHTIVWDFSTANCSCFCFHHRYFSQYISQESIR